MHSILSGATSEDIKSWLLSRNSAPCDFDHATLTMLNYTMDEITKVRHTDAPFYQRFMELAMNYKNEITRRIEGDNPGLSFSSNGTSYFTPFHAHQKVFMSFIEVNILKYPKARELTLEACQNAFDLESLYADSSLPSQWEQFQHHGKPLRIAIRSPDGIGYLS